MDLLLAPSSAPSCCLSADALVVLVALKRRSRLSEHSSSAVSYCLLTGCSKKDVDKVVDTLVVKDMDKPKAVYCR